MNKTTLTTLVLLLFTAILLSACASEPAPDSANPESAAVGLLQKGGCGACHVIPGVPGAVGNIGPDLTTAGDTAAERIQSKDYTGNASSPEAYLLESIREPDLYIVPDCPNAPCQMGQMPASLADMFTDDELNTIVQYLAGLTAESGAAPLPAEAEPVSVGEAPPLTEEEFTQATQIFFDRCAGCHGVLRKGATGPALTPDHTLPMGTAALASIIFNGTPRGMPDWGKQGILTQEETELMAKFVQNEPPVPPEMSMQKMLESWQVFTPPEERPADPQTERDWENYFVVTLRDAGQVAVIDGDSYGVANTVDTGYAVHITRMSASGRYAYVIGRDGKVALVDLWMQNPEKVAEVKVCYDARSVETSKFAGFEDKYAIVGCYWPPHFVILDGATLEPLKVVSTRSYTFDTGEYHPEPRVASIVASHAKPQWVVNVKETGQVWLVDYSDPKNPTIKMLEAERFLHDGGWAMEWDGEDLAGVSPYFLVAANMKDKIVVVNTEDEKIEAIVDVGTKPHPGRGMNWVHPEYGPVWATSHLGQGLLSVIGVDPENHPESAWKVVAQIELPAAGSLFVKTHPNSQWLWVDFPLSTDEQMQRSVCVIDKASLEVHRCWEVADYGRAVHMEYNKAGDEVWVSVWGNADEPGKTGEIVIYDDTTLAEIARIPDLVTPTGKFNVYNTVHDIY